MSGASYLNIVVIIIIIIIIKENKENKNKKEKEKKKKKRKKNMIQFQVSIFLYACMHWTHQINCLLTWLSSTDSIILHEIPPPRNCECTALHEENNELFIIISLRTCRADRRGWSFTCKTVNA